MFEASSLETMQSWQVAVVGTSVAAAVRVGVKGCMTSKNRGKKLNYREDAAWGENS